jgi:hypothetical protein
MRPIFNTETLELFVDEWIVPSFKAIYPILLNIQTLWHENTTTAV